jgi:hypothetical protein
VSGVDFSEFCELTKPQYFGYKKQPWYLKDLFKAAGIRRDYSDDHLKAVFNGTKPFASNMKRYFPHPVRIDSIAAFFEKHLQSEYVKLLADAFGIPADEEKNLSYLSYALAAQVAAFISNREETESENIVPDKYEEARVRKESGVYQITRRLYDGDDVWVEDRTKKHAAAFYEKIHHTWVIHNQGNVIWHKRKLVCANPEETGRRTKVFEIEIEELQPGKYIKIATDFNARGQEGKFVSKWDMIDEHGNNCFPGSRNIFDVEINTTFGK